MDGVIEHASDGVSYVRMEVDLRNTHNVICERAPSPMKLDR